jgi:DnaJ-class molecular chaperone
MFLLFLSFSSSLIQSDGNRDFYASLGLPHDCQDRDIEIAFQKLSRKYHPDKNKDVSKSTDQFTDINDAYATLKDPQKRRVYDLYGEGGVHIYESPHNELGELVGFATAESETIARVRKKGRTYRIPFPVDLHDFYFSKVYNLTITRRTMCRCIGPGFFCEKCRGRPTVRESLNLSFFVEKGADDGSLILFENIGDCSELNGPGDVEIEILTKPHSTFVRVGSDLWVTIELSLKEALLGFERKIEGLDRSPIIVKYDRPIIGGDIRLKGKGLPFYLSPGDFGDIVVKPIIKWPTELSDEDRIAIAGVFL